MKPRPSFGLQSTSWETLFYTALLLVKKVGPEASPVENQDRESWDFYIT